MTRMGLGYKYGIILKQAIGFSSLLRGAGQGLTDSGDYERMQCRWKHSQQQNGGEHICLHGRWLDPNNNLFAIQRGRRQTVANNDTNKQSKDSYYVWCCLQKRQSTIALCCLNDIELLC